MKMNAMDYIVMILLIVGGLNWGLVGAFDYNLVSSIFGDGTFTNIIYIIVGLAAIWSLIRMFTMGGGSSATNTNMGQ
jgi:uncharacterized membrane protein YuzA (DUF378 family)